MLIWWFNKSHLQLQYYLVSRSSLILCSLCIKHLVCLLISDFKSNFISKCCFSRHKNKGKYLKLWNLKCSIVVITSINSSIQSVLHIISVAHIYNLMLFNTKVLLYHTFIDAPNKLETECTFSLGVPSRLDLWELFFCSLSFDQHKRNHEKYF